MWRVNTFTAITAAVLVAAASARAGTAPKPAAENSAGVTAPASLPMVKSVENPARAMFTATQESAVFERSVSATAEAGDDDDKNPKSRSTHCPPDKDDHHDFSNRALRYRDDDHKNDGDHDKDKDKDKDKHDDCGKGDDSKNP